MTAAGPLGPAAGRALEDLRDALEHGVTDTREPWECIVEDAMNAAWDALLAADPTKNVPADG